MPYQLQIIRRAQKELSRLPALEYERVRDAIRGLTQEPRPVGCKKLTGREGWRLRVGRYRVLYDIDDNALVITIRHIGHRRDVYRTGD
ncbi:MAG: type II toxin-antitoxin system RelE/ParE family toxin [Anaerolineae bacterium]